MSGSCVSLITMHQFTLERPFYTSGRWSSSYPFLPVFPLIFIGHFQPYTPPGTVGVANMCRCNTVVYNLISACSACQSGVVGTWPTWIQYCAATIINVGKYPNAVPQGTEIPVFAFYDPTITGLFDVDDAQRYIADHTSGGNGNGNRVGRIIGGVVGGIVGFLLAVFGIAFAFVKRFREKVKATLGRSSSAAKRRHSSSLGVPLMKSESFQSDVHPGINRVGMSFERISQDEDD